MTEGVPRAARGALAPRRAPSCASASTLIRQACPRFRTRRRRASSGSPRSSSRRPLPYAAAVKPNLAFFEALRDGRDGGPRATARPMPADVPVIGDAKRATSARRRPARPSALFEMLGADAVTVNPYLGRGAIAPLLEQTDRFAYVLCRTSNPGAAGVQDLRPGRRSRWTDAPEERLHERVARLAATWGPGGTVGLVVGATAPGEMAGGPARSCRAGDPGARGSARRAGPRRLCSRRGRATDGPAGQRPGGGLLVNCRATSPGRRRRAPGTTHRARRGGRPDWAGASLC